MELIEDIGTIESRPKMEGRTMVMVVTPIEQQTRGSE
jgi:translation initiation factor IF-3